MSDQEKKGEAPKLPQLFSPDGKPLKVLSTSLGIALLANALYSAGTPGSASADTAVSSASPTASGAAASEAPVLAEWSSEEVKAYFDPSVDWNIPLTEEELKEPPATEAAAGVSGGGTGGSGGSGGGTTVIHTSSGFGWDDLLLYHMIMGNGNTYSSGAYYGGRTAYDASTGQVYKPRSYGSEAFQNKPVVGSAVRPKTSSSSGSITRRSTSSSAGGIGGKSSGFSSSSSSKSSGGGFGG